MLVETASCDRQGTAAAPWLTLDVLDSLSALSHLRNLRTARAPMPWRYLVGLGCDGASPWNAMTPCMAGEATLHGIPALKPTAQRVGAAITRCRWSTTKRARRRGVRRLRWERGDSRWAQRLTAAPRRWAVGMRAAMAWRAVLPLMDGVMASAVAVATHPTPMEHRQASSPTRRPKASIGEGGLTVDATIDGGH